MPRKRIWDRKSNFKFIRLYRQQSCLWNVDDPYHRDKYSRDKAIQSIMTGIGIPDLTAMEVKKRIKSLRTTHSMEVKKIWESMQSDEYNVYKPKLSWFDEMSEFINYNEEKYQKQRMNENEPTFKTEYIENETENDNNEEAVYLVDNLEDWNTQVNVPSTSNHMHKKRAKMNEETALYYRKDKDEFDIFGLHVASQLRLLSTKQTILAQEEIQSVLSKHRLHDLRTVKEERGGNNRVLMSIESEDEDTS